MILDKLIEKKDLELYIKFRMRSLYKVLRDDIKYVPEKKRELACRHIRGRIDELRLLLHSVMENKVKDMSKLLWKPEYTSYLAKLTPFEFKPGKRYMIQVGDEQHSPNLGELMKVRDGLKRLMPDSDFVTVPYTIRPITEKDITKEG